MEVPDRGVQAYGGEGGGEVGPEEGVEKERREFTGSRGAAGAGREPEGGVGRANHESKAGNSISRLGLVTPHCPG